MIAGRLPSTALPHTFAGTALLSAQVHFRSSGSLAEPGTFKPVESGVLALGILLSAGLFFWRFGPILRNILRSKKDPNFKLSPIGRRVWIFLSEVLCQSKVIRQRPLPGL